MGALRIEMPDYGLGLMQWLANSGAPQRTGYDSNQPVLGTPQPANPMPDTAMMMHRAYTPPAPQNDGAVVFRPHIPTDAAMREIFRLMTRKK